MKLCLENCILWNSSFRFSPASTSPPTVKAKEDISNISDHFVEMTRAMLNLFMHNISKQSNTQHCCKIFKARLTILGHCALKDWHQRPWPLFITHTKKIVLIYKLQSKEKVRWGSFIAGRKIDILNLNLFPLVSLCFGSFSWINL